MFSEPKLAFYAGRDAVGMTNGYVVRTWPILPGLDFKTRHPTFDLNFCSRVKISIRNEISRKTWDANSLGDGV